MHILMAVSTLDLPSTVVLYARSSRPYAFSSSATSSLTTSTQSPTTL